MPAFRYQVAGWRQLNIVLFAALIFTVTFAWGVALGSSSEAVRHFNLGSKAFQGRDLLANTGEIDEASRQFRSAIRLRPEFSQAHENLGLVLLKIRRG